MVKESNKGHRICGITPGSIAEEMGVEPGDFLCAVNGQEIKDIFDYNFLMADEYVEILIRTADGQECVLEVEKEEEEDFGAEFESYLMDEYSSCRNKCIFCFIDQMPPGMRKTLYFKDDDSRLSFLQGNYVTLTNMSDYDVDRICRYHMEPINISIHTMNPELRCKMLNNRFAGDALKKIDVFNEHGILMNGQIVLCKGINDDRELDFSIEKLLRYIPLMQSVSVVPVGLTKFREGLYKLEPFEKDDAGKLIDQIERWQNICLEKFGTRFIFASDVWYIKAGRALPSPEEYEDFPQLENGVGMISLFLKETKEAIRQNSGRNVKRIKVSSFCGTAVYPYINECAQMIMKAFPVVDIKIHPLVNHFFGEQITVTGLLTGSDIINGLEEILKKDEDALGDVLLVPSSVLRSGETVFLDDLTIEDVSGKFDIEVRISDSGGDSFVESVLSAGDGGYVIDTEFRRNKYEQTDSGNSWET